MLGLSRTCSSLISIFCFVFVLLFLSPSFSLVSASTLELETFDSSISNLALWSYTRMSGVSFLTENNRDYAHFEGYNSTTFPYVRSIDLTSLPLYKIVFDVRFASNSITQGSGIIITDNVPLEGGVLDFNLLLFYIWPKPNGTYHLFTPICSIDNHGCNSSSQLINGVVQIPSDVWQKIELKYSDSRYFFYLDDSLVFESQDTERIVKTIAIGQPEIVRSSSTWSSFDIDNIEILDNESSEFPYYSQLDPLWVDIEYNQASEWAPENEEGIGRWGCVITSSAMVFGSFGINTPTNEEPTPAALNTWLSDEDDGYIRNGLVNWIALTRMARESYSNGFGDTKVEFTKNGDFDVDSLDFPTILEIPGHFLVSHGENGENLNINDPISAENKLLAKTETILSTNTFTASNTDLSYMMFVVDAQFDIELSDSSSNILGSVYEEQLIDDIDGSSATEILKILYYAKPSDGYYKVKIINLGEEEEIYNLDVYLYDDQANVYIPTSNFSYSLDSGETDQYFFEYSKSDNIQGSITPLNSLSDIVWEFYDNGKIHNKGVAQAIVRMDNYAERFSIKSPWLSNRIIDILQKYIIRHTPRIIDSDASEFLLRNLLMIQF